jgi:hypothetical protein
MATLKSKVIAVGERVRNRKRVSFGADGVDDVLEQQRLAAAFALLDGAPLVLHADHLHDDAIELFG